MAGFSIQTLVALYDQGCLVPFIGSGISTGPCVSWAEMVNRLCLAAAVSQENARSNAIGDANARRAAPAVRALSCKGGSLADVLRSSLYDEDQENRYGRNELLAELYWPLICTTNYDDTYLGARIKQAENKAKASEKGKTIVTLPRIYGRSETNCRRIVQHMTSASGENYWAIQGMLRPRDYMLRKLGQLIGDGNNVVRTLSEGRLESELVVGPVEYRKVANQALHFRRAFAEMFYHRSLLFLGAGLSEPYILSLFDEALDILGLPSRPHFALVDKNKVDCDFLRTHYNIICETYDGPQEYGKLDDLLRNLVSNVRKTRPQVQQWAYRMDRNSTANRPSFLIEGTALPQGPSHPDEALVISVGRSCDSAFNPYGEPLLGNAASQHIKNLTNFRWLNSWVGTWSDKEYLYAIAARETCGEVKASSKDLRSPDVVRRSFKAFLDCASERGITSVRTMLLAAGPHRTFQPWVSLVQMARAYGEWYTEYVERQRKQPVTVTIHVVAEDVLAQLRQGQLGLVERLHGNTEIRFKVEIIDAEGAVHLEPYVLSEDTAIGDLPILKLIPGMTPALGVSPFGRPSKILREFEFFEVKAMSLKNFGIVTGSTLIVNFRRTWRDNVDD